MAKVSLDLVQKVTIFVESECLFLVGVRFEEIYGELIN